MRLFYTWVESNGVRLGAAKAVCFKLLSHSGGFWWLIALFPSSAGAWRYICAALLLFRGNVGHTINISLFIHVTLPLFVLPWPILPQMLRSPSPYKLPAGKREHELVLFFSKKLMPKIMSSFLLP